MPKSKNIGVFVMGYPGMTVASAIKKILFARALTRGRIVCVGVDKKLDDIFMRNYQGKKGNYRHKMLGDIDSILEGFNNYSFHNEDLNFDICIEDAHIKIAANSFVSDKYEKYILIAPIATTIHKQWPVNNFIVLINELRKYNNEYEYVLIGSPEQFEQVENAFSNIGFEIKNLCGQLSIEELAVLMKRAKGYIGNDGGMSQLAGLVGCPSVIVFNSIEDDWVTHPWRSSNGIVRNRTDCSPCHNSFYCPQGHMKCMSGISAESVISKAKDIIFEN